MPTDNTLLRLFKEQLDNESTEIAKTNGLTQRGQQLIWWYFIRLHSFSPEDVEEVACDGINDLGIDAVWIDDEACVHFYQFKNPVDLAPSIADGDVDRVLSGLRLILAKEHGKVANEELRARVDTIYQSLPSGYRLHLVSSGGGLAATSETKLNAFVNELQGPTPTYFQWEAEDLKALQDRFYRQRLPAVEDPICFQLDRTPYMVRSAEADSYFFHVPGRILADLYDAHGEQLLQRNIRVDQGNTATNRSIESTCSGDDAGNFLHYNNGVSFLCDSAGWDQFLSKLTLNKAQVVNGGQTIRALSRAKERQSLRRNVVVSVRAITSKGDKDFASNVAVNQNNQNQMGTGFLRSNDPKVVQLAHSLASMGWYLERRDGELQAADDAERAAIENRIGRSLDGRVITLKEGTQAYVATFFGQPELAKKNAKKMFLSAPDGGFFDRIFSPSLTAERFVIAHQAKSHVDDFIRQFMTRKRRKERVDDWKADYRLLLGDRIMDEFSHAVDSVVPQSGVFLCGIIYQDHVEIQKKDPTELPALLAERGLGIIRSHVVRILEYSHSNPRAVNKSWPSLLKSNAFFQNVVAYMRGVKEGVKSNGGSRH